ncbi:MAG: aspartyl protease, partial [Thermoproteota archaeon]
MGHVKEPIKLYHGSRSMEVAALIDTGATTLILPKGVAEELGVEALGEMDVEL